MSNPSGPDQPDDVTDDVKNDAVDAEPVQTGYAQDAESATEVMNAEHEPATEIMSPARQPQEQAETDPSLERRYTAPSGFDAGATQRIDTPAEPATEVFAPQAKPIAPQVIPPRVDTPKSPSTRRSWGWVIALLLVIAALVAVAVLGTVLLTRNSEPKASQEDMVRTTIQNYDIAIQNGDLATLRSITCGSTRDSYVKYDDQSWAQTHKRVAAAKQYPVVASIDQVVVNGDHAEANITTFMAYAPQTRSTRSLDLEFRDEQWKICQAPGN